MSRNIRIYTAEQLSDPLSAAIIDELIGLLARSFTEDVSHMWLFRNESTPEAFLAALTAYFRFIVHYSILCHASFRVVTDGAQETNAGEKTTSSTKQSSPQQTICAVAILIPPHGNAAYDATWTAIRGGYVRLFWKCGIRFNWRMLIQFVPGLDRMHDVMFPDPKTKYHNWHLFYLATDAKFRGQGLGRRILLDIQAAVKEFNEEALRKARTTSQNFSPTPIYLEASNPDNRRLYNSVGFEDRTTMTYGKIADGEDLKMGSDNKVIGGRQFGMVWSSHPVSAV